MFIGDDPNVTNGDIARYFGACFAMDPNTNSPCMVMGIERDYVRVRFENGKEMVYEGDSSRPFLDLESYYIRDLGWRNYEDARGVRTCVHLGRIPTAGVPRGISMNKLRLTRGGEAAMSQTPSLFKMEVYPYISNVVPPSEGQIIGFVHQPPEPMSIESVLPLMKERLFGGIALDNEIAFIRLNPEHSHGFDGAILAHTKLIALLDTKAKKAKVSGKGIGNLIGGFDGFAIQDRK